MATRSKRLGGARRSLFIVCTLRCSPPKPTLRVFKFIGCITSCYLFLVHVMRFSSKSYLACFLFVKISGCTTRCASYVFSNSLVALPVMPQFAFRSFGCVRQRSMQLLRGEVLPDIISYNSAITACGNAEQWQQALALLWEIPNQVHRAAEKRATCD